MSATTAPSPVGQPVDLGDGRRLWIRVPSSGTGAAHFDHHWHREVVDASGQIVAAAAYEGHGSGPVPASVWVAPAWRSAGLGTLLWSMLTEAAERHGIRWLTCTAKADDEAAHRVLQRSGWIVARRVRGEEARVAVLLSRGPRHSAVDVAA